MYADQSPVACVIGVVRYIELILLNNGKLVDGLDSSQQPQVKGEKWVQDRVEVG